MDVPITSDLAGYTRFWTKAVCVLALLGSANLWLLWRILVAVKAK